MFGKSSRLPDSILIRYFLMCFEPELSPLIFVGFDYGWGLETLPPGNGVEPCFSLKNLNE